VLLPHRWPGDVICSMFGRLRGSLCFEASSS
jgi:hypothetical protein